MKRYKKLGILVGVLAVICAAAFAVSSHEEKKEKIKNSNDTILSINKDDVTSLSWEYEDHSYAFHKDGSWVYDSDADFPVSHDEIDNLLDVFTSFDAAFTIDDVEDFGQYGLDDPTCTIKLAAGDKEYEIQLGDYSKMDEERYVSIGDGKVYLAAKDPFDSYEVEMTDLIQNDSIPDMTDVTELVFSGSKDYTAVREDDNNLTYDEDDKYFVDENGEKTALDTTNVENYVKVMEDLDLTDYVTYNASDAQLEKYGLAEPALTVNVSYTEKTGDGDDEKADENGTGESGSQKFTLNISKCFDGGSSEKNTKTDDDDSTAADSSSENSSDITDDLSNKIAYVRVGESGIIYKISGTTYGSLMASGVDDLRHQQLVWADTSIITGMDITLDGDTYSFTSKAAGGNDKDKSDDEDTDNTSDRNWYYNGKKIEDISDVMDAIGDIKATDFTDKTPDQKEEIGVLLHLENDNVQEVSLKLFRYDGSLCIAQVDDTDTAMVDRSLVVNLIEAVNAIVLQDK